MIGRDELWRRVNTALDARLDPLEDESVVEALLEQPDEFQAVRRLLGRVADIERTATASETSRSIEWGLPRVAGWAAAAVVTAASVVLWLGSRPAFEPEAQSSPVSVPLTNQVRESRVLRWEVSLERCVTAPPGLPGAPPSRATPPRATPPDVVSAPAPTRPSASRLVRLDFSVEHQGQRRGETRVVLGRDGTYSITRTTGSPVSDGAPLLAATLE